MTLPGAPTLVVERTRPPAPPAAWPLADRVAWAAIGLALLAVAVLRLLRLVLPAAVPLLADDRPARLVSPLAVGGLIALGAAVAVPPRCAGRAARRPGGRRAGAAGARSWGGTACRRLDQGGGRRRGALPGRLGAAAPLGTARPLRRHPGLDRRVRPAARPHRGGLRPLLPRRAGARGGGRASAARPRGLDRRRPAARRRRPLRPAAARPPAARRRRRPGRRLRRPAAAAGGARPGRPGADGRLRRRRHLGDGLPTAAARVRRRRAAGPPVAAEAGGDRRRLARRSASTSRRIDLEQVVPRTPVGLERQDLAYALWKDSPLARHHSLSALVVQRENARPPPSPSACR